MAYRVTQEEFKGVLAVVLEDPERGQSATVLPSIGSNCVSFRVARGDSAVEVLLVPPDPETLLARPSGYGVPILFPWPNRMERGTFAFEGTAVKLDPPKSGLHVLHGFVLNRPWKVLSQGASTHDGAWVTSRFRSADHEDVTRQWPFPFEIDATYRLRGGGLSLEVKARNPGPTNLPCGLGFHPYFPLPLENTGSRDLCTVQVPCERTWTLRPDNVPTGEIKEVEGAFDLRKATPLAGRFYDHVWTDVRLEDGWSRCTFEDPRAGVRIAVDADEVFREWVLYAPESRPVVCFEPYTCTTNAHNLQGRGVDAGLIVLKPGQTLEGTVRFVPEIKSNHR